MEKNSFQLLHYKLLQSDVTAAAWSNAMDLVAVGFRDRRVAVYRLSFERVCIVEVDDVPTVLAWRPQGRDFAAGLENGSVVVVDPQKGGNIIRRHSVNPSFPCKISALSWSDGPTLDAVASMWPSSVEEVLPPIQEIQAEQDIGEGGSLSFKDSYFSPFRSRLDVLVAADVSGRVSFFVFGEWCVASLPPSKIGGAVAAVGLATASSHCFGLVGTPREGNRWFSISEQNALYSAQSTLFSQHADECSLLSSLFSALVRIFEDGGAMISSMQKTAQSVVEQLNSRFSQLEALKKDHGDTSSIADDFLNLIAVGVMPPSLEQFLVSLPSSTGASSSSSLVQWTKETMSGFHLLRSAVRGALLPLGERLVCVSSLLRGTSGWIERFELMHVNVETVQSLERTADLLCLRAEEFSDLLELVETHLYSFFRWLNEIIFRYLDESEWANEVFSRELPPEDDFLIAFLDDMFLFRSIVEPVRDKMRARPFFPRPADDAVRTSMDVDQRRSSLTVVLNDCQQIAEQVFYDLHESLSESHSCFSRSIDAKFERCSGKCRVVGDVSYLVIHEESGSAINLFRLRAYEWESSAVCPKENGEDMIIVDCCFSGDEQIAVLASLRDEGTSILGLLDLASFDFSKSSNSALSVPFARRRILRVADPSLLTVSGERNLAGVIVRNCRMMVIDLTDVNDEGESFMTEGEDSTNASFS